MNEQLFCDVMMDIAREGGKLARTYFTDSRPSLKADRSIVTRADHAISRLAHRKLARFLKSSDHILIDEEDPGMKRYLDRTLLKKTKYVWSVDPIDGTRNYANQIPQFGISIGLIRNSRPWMGVVYFPVSRELFYCDGRRGYFVQNAFTKQEQKKKLKAIHKKVDGRTYFLATDTFFKSFSWDHKDCRIMIQSCAVIELCWPAIGRGCAGLIKSSLWDFAGSWPVLRAAGLDLRALHSGKKLDRLDLDVFDPQIPWRLNDFYVISNKRNFSVIKTKIRRK